MRGDSVVSGSLCRVVWLWLWFGLVLLWFFCAAGMNMNWVCWAAAGLDGYDFALASCFSPPEGEERGMFVCNVCRLSLR